MPAYKINRNSDESAFHNIIMEHPFDKNLRQIYENWRYENSRFPIRYERDSPIDSIGSVGINDYRRFIDVVYNKHKGGLIPIDSNSNLVKNHFNEDRRHNLVAFRNDDQNTKDWPTLGEHFLHGAIIKHGDKMSLHVFPFHDALRDAYREGYLGLPRKPKGLDFGNITVDPRYYQLGHHDGINFRPPGESAKATLSDLYDEVDPTGAETNTRTSLFDTFARSESPLLSMIFVGAGHGVTADEKIIHGIHNIWKGKRDITDGRKDAGDLIRTASDALSQEHDHDNDDDVVESIMNDLKKRESRVAHEQKTKSWMWYVQDLIDKHFPNSRWSSS